MGDTWVTDMRHYLDEDGGLPEGIPVPALNLARFLGSIVCWVTSHRGNPDEQTNVACRRAQGQRPCIGDIYARFDDGGTSIRWECPLCGDNGYISGWQDTIWDRRRSS